MTKTAVYFETNNGHCEKVAIIDSDLYSEIYSHIEDFAKKNRMFVTDSEIEEGEADAS